MLLFICIADYISGSDQIKPIYPRDERFTHQQFPKAELALSLNFL